MKKKYLPIFISAALCAALITGCGGQNQSSTAETSEAQESQIQEDSQSEEDSQAEEEQGNTVSGQVTEITESSVTVDGTAYDFADDMTVTRQMGQMPEGMEKPDGDMSDMGDAPEKPDGEGGDGQMPGGMEMPGGDMTWEDISVGDDVTLTLNEDGKVSEIAVSVEMGMGGGMGQGGGQSSGVDSYEAAVDISDDVDISGEDYTSTGTDENAILVSGGAKVTLDDITVDRTSEDSTGGDNASFYGVGAAILTTDGTTTISNAQITTDAKGGAGVFSYGDSVVTVSDSTIKTNEDTSGGIHVAGGGTLYANDLTVETNGESSAAIRSDRGGGTMVVDGGSYTSNGTGSPAIYCTADITVSDAELTATGSEAVCIEGFNSLTLTDCDLSGAMKDDNDQNDCTWNVILYQSMSGDSEVGNSTFSMTGGSLTAENGGMFYTTNTESTFVLEDVDITYADDNDFFLRCTGNNNARGWGSAGSNGADCTFTAIDQEMEGDVIWDSISTLDMALTEGSKLTGAVVDDESCAGNGGSGSCKLSLDEDSTWVVTGDSTLTTLENKGTIVDADGNTVSIVGNDGTVYVEGSSAYTVTVDTYEA